MRVSKERVRELCVEALCLTSEEQKRDLLVAERGNFLYVNYAMIGLLVDPINCCIVAFNCIEELEALLEKERGKNGSSAVGE